MSKKISDSLSQWRSERLQINRLFADSEKVNKEFLSQVAKVLTDKVVKELPPNWQGIETIEHAGSWLERQTEEGELYEISIINNEEFQQLVGFVVLYESETEESVKVVHLGYVVAEPFWGKGYATEILISLIERLTELDEPITLLAGVDENNLASRKVLEKSGFYLSADESPNKSNLFYSLSIGETV